MYFFLLIISSILISVPCPEFGPWGGMGGGAGQDPRLFQIIKVINMACNNQRIVWIQTQFEDGTLGTRLGGDPNLVTYYKSISINPANDYIRYVDICYDTYAVSGRGPNPYINMVLFKSLNGYTSGGDCGSRSLSNQQCMTVDLNGALRGIFGRGGSWLDRIGFLSCDPSCMQCSGAGSNQCTSCASGSYISGGYCLKCDPLCTTCIGPGSTSCTACSAGYFLLGNTCQNSCPAHYFANSATRVCQQCDGSCNSCFGPYNNQCYSCYSNYFLTSDYRCNICPSAYKCKECLSPDGTKCASCIQGKYFLTNQCYDACPPGFYGEIRPTESVCILCNPSCKTCSGGSINQCLDCANGFTKIQNMCISGNQIIYINQDPI